MINALVGIDVHIAKVVTTETISSGIRELRLDR